MPTTVLFILVCCLRTQHLQHEDARRYQLTIAAEDAAAQASVRKELMASQLAVEDQTNKVRDCAGACVFQLRFKNETMVPLFAAELRSDRQRA